MKMPIALSTEEGPQYGKPESSDVDLSDDDKDITTKQGTSTEVVKPKLSQPSEYLPEKKHDPNRSVFDISTRGLCKLFAHWVILHCFSSLLISIFQKKIRNITSDEQFGSKSGPTF